MFRKGFWWIGLSLAAVILIGAGLFFLLLTKPSTQEPQALEKGAQITQLPAPLTPYPTGPTEPTPLPTTSIATSSTPQTSASATAQQYTAPTVTGPATVVAATPTDSPPTATPKPANYIIPQKINIPSIKVDTFVERLGLTKDGLMDVPKNIWNTGWFGNGGYRPGEQGNAVIDGHLDAPGSKAVFWDLDQIKVGDSVILTDQAGKQLTFQVYDKKFYPYNDAPMATIFGPSTEAHLNLITCGGTFDRSSQTYNKRLVVFTKLVTNS